MAGIDTGTWLNGSALYQVYPLSFRDGDGDGWGDLHGLLSGLEHIAGLGVDGLWISPFYTSPLADFGYDVADHTAVDPRFGSLAAFDAVLAEAHRLGLKVLVDLVLGHTSDRHPWFRDSRRSRDNPLADRYVWADPAPDGTAPNNWLSVFGGPAWTWEPRRRQYYLHHFLPQQPTLNYRAPGVLAAMLDVARFWLDRGVDGFRVDAVDFLMRNPQLRRNPPVEPTPATVPAKPFGLQMHVHDMMHPDIRPLLERLRAVTDAYGDRVLLGELSSQPGAGERIERYTATLDGRAGLHAAYTLEVPKQPFTAQTFHRALLAAMDGAQTCWSFSNHDVERAVTRWLPAGADPVRFSGLLALLLACLPGTVCVYQGDELGLPQAELAHEDLRDPFGLNFWPDFKGRDGSRTPIPWRDAGANAGFCPEGVRPWLPLDARHPRLAVARQENDPAFPLSLWRAALALRRTEPALKTGRVAEVDEDGPVLAFLRRNGQGGAIRCVFNLGDAPARYSLPEGTGTDLLTLPAAFGPAASLSGETLDLPPLAAALLRHPT